MKALKEEWVTASLDPKSSERWAWRPSSFPLMLWRVTPAVVHVLYLQMEQTTMPGRPVGHQISFAMRCMFHKISEHLSRGWSLSLVVATVFIPICTSLAILDRLTASLCPIPSSSKVPRSFCVSHHSLRWWLVAWPFGYRRYLSALVVVPF